MTYERLRRLAAAVTVAAVGVMTLTGTSRAHVTTPGGSHAITSSSSGSTSAAARVPHAHTVTGGSNRAVAVTQAASLLTTVTVPSGSTSSVIEPSGGGVVLARPASYPLTPNLVDDHAWWVVPGTPRAAIASIEAHPPHGAQLNLSGSGNVAPGFQFVGYGWGPVTQVLSSRSVVIEVVQLPGGHTGLRVDAEVVWIMPRPVNERIPSGAARLKVSVTRGRQTLQRPFTITDRHRIQRAAALIDSLPVLQPGTSSCPSDSGVEDRLTFQSPVGRPLAVITAGGFGCGGVTVVIRGQRQAALPALRIPAWVAPAMSRWSHSSARQWAYR